MTWQRLRLEFLRGEAEWSEFYGAYLDSPEWQSHRQKVLERDGHKCRLRASHPGPFQVHHSNYENLKWHGREESADMITLCLACHEMVTDANRSDEPVRRWESRVEQLMLR